MFQGLMQQHSLMISSIIEFAERWSVSYTHLTLPTTPYV